MVGLLGGRKAGLQDALPAQHGGVGGIQNADGGGAYAEKLLEKSGEKSGNHHGNHHGKP